MKTWNKDTFDNATMKKEQLLQTIQFVEQEEERGSFSNKQRVHRIKAKDEFQELALREEIMRRQKSRVNWLRHGDCNTKFFHSFANGRKLKNQISSLAIDKIQTHDTQRIENEILAFYKQLYSTETPLTALFSSWSGKSLSLEMNNWLERPLSDEEIKLAVFTLASEKAPGPDGFSMAFFQGYWDIVQKDIVKLLKEFHSYGKISRGLNSTFITLIPKNTEASKFRPISLISAPYKVISKVLSNGIREVLHEVIDGNQYVFIKGRQILDRILIANECVERYKRGNLKGVVVKTGLRKSV